MLYYIVTGGLSEYSVFPDKSMFELGIQIIEFIRSNVTFI